MAGSNVYFIANVRPCRFAASPAVVLTEDSILSDLPAIRSGKPAECCRFSRSCTKITTPLRQGADESSDGQPPRQGVQGLRLIEEVIPKLNILQQSSQ
jgi:hypothetical protein